MMRAGNTFHVSDEKLPMLHEPCVLGESINKNLRT